jgi:hypothetical protein
MTLLMFLLAFPFAAYTAEVTIEGRVLAESGALSSAVVSAHSSYSDMQNGLNPVAAIKTDAEGIFRISLQSPRRTGWPPFLCLSRQ